MWALHSLWKEVGFDSLAAVFRRARYTTPIEHAVRVMVFNRLCDPDSKLGVLRWLQTVSLPEVDVGALTHQPLLRSMDALMDNEQVVDEMVAGLLRPMVDQALTLAFYDMTTIRIEGRGEVGEDIRRYGLSKEGGIARQVMLGVVQTAEGLPIYHEVFDGNQSEGLTLLPTLKKVLERFPHIRRLVIVADRGLLSLDNMQLGEVLQMHIIELAKAEMLGALPAPLMAWIACLLHNLDEAAMNEITYPPVREALSHLEVLYSDEELRLAAERREQALVDAEDMLYQARYEGTADLLAAQLTHKFGPLPGWAATRMAQADEAALNRWALRILDTQRIEDVFS